MDCETASVGFRGVWETQGSASVEGGPVGVGVRSLISNVDSTACGSKGTRPVPQKPALMFFSVIVAKWADLKAMKNSVLVMWLICALMNSSISRLYIRFSILKQPTSSGWVRWEE